MKNVIVAVWGNPGAGASTFCAALAKGLSRSLSYLLLCSSNPITPAYAQWNVLAGTEAADPQMKNAEPMRKVLDYPDITVPYIKKRLIVHPDIKQLGLLGGFIGERYEQYNPVKGNAAGAFLDCARQMAQVTILDCMQPQWDVLSGRALEKADLILTIIEPNALGAAFRSSQKHILTSLPELPARKLFLAGKVGKKTPVEVFEYNIGIHFDARIPYDEAVRDKLERLELFSVYGGLYGKTVDAVIQAIKEEMQLGGDAKRAV